MESIFGVKIRKLLLIQLLIFLILSGLTAFLFIPVRNAVDEKLLRLKEEAVQYLENVIGREISYSEVSPSFFRSIKIKGLKVYDGKIRVSPPRNSAGADLLPSFQSPARGPG